MSVRLVHLVLAALIAASLSACAARQPPNPDYDPWESVNRKVFWFNDRADHYVLEPAARGWNYVVPTSVQRCIGNFFNNLRFPVLITNYLLRGQPYAALRTFERLETNTILGGLGFFDVAADYYDLPPSDEDLWPFQSHFGLTLATWGVPSGPYLVLPLLGPSSPRDAVGLGVDYGFNVYTYYIPLSSAATWGLFLGTGAVDIVNYRARYLDAIERAKEASLDYYTFTRNAYVQRRWRLLNATGERMSPEQEKDLYNADLYETPPDTPSH